MNDEPFYIYIYFGNKFYLFIFYNIKKKLNIFNKVVIFLNHCFLLLILPSFITQNINTHTFITVFINLVILAINFFITLQLLFFQLVCKSIHKRSLRFSIRFFSVRSSITRSQKSNILHRK